MRIGWRPIAVVVVGLAALGAALDREAAPNGEPAARPVVFGRPWRSAPTVAPVAVRPHDDVRVDALPASRRAEAERAAELFLGALLRWERPPGARADARLIRRWSTGTLADAVLSRAPRRLSTGPPPPPGRLTEVTAGRGDAEDLLVVVATVRRGNRLGALTLVLTRRGDRWRVTELRR